MASYWPLPIAVMRSLSVLVLICTLSLAISGCSKKELSFNNVEDNAKVKFSSGTKSGVAVNSSGNLTIDTDSIGGVSLDSSWTPEYSSLVAHWNFDGSWVDTVEGYSMTSFDSAGFTTDTHLGSGSSSYDGVDDYAQATTNTGGLGDVDFGDDITISYWIRVEALQADTTYTSNIAATVIVAGGYVGRFFYRNQNNPTPGLMRFCRYDGSSSVCPTSTSRIDDGNYHHIVGVKSGSTVSIYVDGVLEQSLSDPTSLVGTVSSVQLSSPSHTQAELTGEIDEYAIWHKALSADQILSIYNKQKPKYSGALDPSWTAQYEKIVGYWKMDGNWLDASGSGNHGTANGNAGFSTSARVGSQAGGFDGVGDYVEIPQDQTLEIETGDFSISTWFKVDSMPVQFIGLFTKGAGDSTNEGYSFIYQGSPFNRLVLWLCDGSARLSTYSTVMDLNDGLWHHALVSVDRDGQTNFYLDGVFWGGDDSDHLGEDIVNGSSHLQLSNWVNAGWYLDGNLDDVALWKGYALSAAEASEIYHRQKQKYAGSFTSHIFDFGTTGSWLGLDVVTPLPFMKELPGQNGSESSSEYSSLEEGLENGLRHYYQLNQSLDDMVGTNNLTQSGDFDFQSNAIFGDAGKFDGDEDLLTGTQQAFITGGGSYSISIWLKPDIDILARSTIFSGGTSLSDRVAISTSSTTADELSFGVYDGSSWIGVSGSYRKGEWNHIVAICNAGSRSFYINGIEVSGANQPYAVSGYKIGANGNGNADFFGLLDEIAIWNRALTDGTSGTANEILQLYRRGANRLKYQVRSCAQPDCSDSEWKGPGGDGTTYYSELFNRLSSNFNFSCSLNTTDSDSSVCVDDEISFLGSPLVLAPSLLFRDMAGSAALDRNRYFQFKVLMESDDENNLCSGSPCLPELKSLKVRHSP